MSVFLNRVREFAKAKNLSLRAISLAAGQSESYLSNSIKQGSIPSAEILSNIIDKYPELNPYWLLTGKGDMELETGKKVQIEGQIPNNRSIDDLIDEKIDKKIKTLTDSIRELIVSEMEDELEAAREELRNTTRKGKVK